MEHIERQVALPVLSHHLFDHRVRIVAPATLLIAKRPKGRQWHVAREFSIAIKNLLDRWTIEEVVVHLTAFGAKPGALLRRTTKIKVAAITVVKEKAVGRAALQADVERDGL